MKLIMKKLKCIEEEDDIYDINDIDKNLEIIDDIDLTISKDSLSFKLNHQHHILAFIFNNDCLVFDTKHTKKGCLLPFYAHIKNHPNFKQDNDILILGTEEILEIFDDLFNVTYELQDLENDMYFEVESVDTFIDDVFKSSGNKTKINDPNINLSKKIEDADAKTFKIILKTDKIDLQSTLSNIDTIYDYLISKKDKTSIEINVYYNHNIHRYISDDEHSLDYIEDYSRRKSYKIPDGYVVIITDYDGMYYINEKINHPDIDIKIEELYSSNEDIFTMETDLLYHYPIIK